VAIFSAGKRTRTLAAGWGMGLGRGFDSFPCYYRGMFKLGKPETPIQWIGHIVLAVVALFLVWWMLRVYVL
jgi:hypothetical protein